jgi:pyrrolidone-carboxylate peptidase
VWLWFCKDLQESPDTLGEASVNGRVVIVTGFGRFRDYRSDEQNPSTPLARQFANDVVSRNVPCEVVAPVPVNWGEIDHIMATQVERHRESRITWIAFGAGKGFAIETRGLNQRTTDMPDVSGRWAGRDVPLVNDVADDLDAAEEITLSAEFLLLMQQALAARGIEVTLSSDAGGYICNSAAYAIYKAQRAGTIEAGMFFHTPETVTTAQRTAFVTALVDVLFADAGRLGGLMA